MLEKGRDKRMRILTVVTKTNKKQYLHLNMCKISSSHVAINLGSF